MLWGGQSRPIKEQRSGFGGGRVSIIGGLGGGKLSSFVLNSGVPHGVDGFPYCFSGNSLNITSLYDSSVNCRGRKRPYITHP